MGSVLSVVDLFCGAGGLSKGFELYNLNGRFDGPNPKVKFEVLAGLDLYQPALDSFYQNHDVEPGRFAQSTDISKVDGADIRAATGQGQIDVVIGGPPCQGFSQAGNREASDERNQLVKDYARIVGELKPTFFVMENVPGLRKTLHAGTNSYLDWVVKKFSGMGYTVSFYQLTASEFGVPQNRKRVVVLGSRGQGQLPAPAPTNSAQPDLAVRQKPIVTVGDAIMDLPKPTPTEQLQSYDQEPTSRYAKLMRAGSKGVRNHILPKHGPEMIAKIEKQQQGTRLYPNFNHAWIRLHLGRPSPTVKQNNRAPSVHPTQHRVTTAREMARLQSFPDAFVFAGTKSAQLHQIGNAVPPFLAKALAQVVAAQAR
jgi:DNA (cytosine-5)-methyltransferase 1